MDHKGIGRYIKISITHLRMARVSTIIYPTMHLHSIIYYLERHSAPHYMEYIPGNIQFWQGHNPFVIIFVDV